MANKKTVPSVAMCQLVQALVKSDLARTEELVRINLKGRHSNFVTRELSREMLRDAIWMLRLHRAVLTLTPEELAHYGVDNETTIRRK